jgi:hypothetical protein
MVIVTQITQIALIRRSDTSGETEIHFLVMKKTMKTAPIVKKYVLKRIIIIPLGIISIYLSGSFSTVLDILFSNCSRRKFNIANICANSWCSFLNDEITTEKCNRIAKMNIEPTTNKALGG